MYWVGFWTYDIYTTAVFCVVFLLIYFLVFVYYFHSYAVALNVWDSESVSKSSAIIKLFIQDNFWEFVNPVNIVNPLNFPPPSSLVFSWAHHTNWLPSFVIIEPWLLWSTMPCGYWVTVPEPKFLPLGKKSAYSSYFRCKAHFRGYSLYWVNLCYFEPCYITTLIKELFS